MPRKTLSLRGSKTRGREPLRCRWQIKQRRSGCSGRWGTKVERPRTSTGYRKRKSVILAKRSFAPPCGRQGERIATGASALAMTTIFEGAVGQARNDNYLRGGGWRGDVGIAPYDNPSVAYGDSVPFAVPGSRFVRQADLRLADRGTCCAAAASATGSAAARSPTGEL